MGEWSWRTAACGEVRGCVEGCRVNGRTHKSKGEEEWYLHNNDSMIFSKWRNEQIWELLMMWADTRIVWHIQKTVEGSVMHSSVIKYPWDVFAPPTLHLKLKQIRWIANVCDNVCSQDSPVVYYMCEENLDLILRKSSGLHIWKRLTFTSHILCISTVSSWSFSSF